MQPRFIRLRDAHQYLGMDRNRFNKEVRPYLISVRIGQQGVAFDRLDLDQWADQYKKNHGIPGKRRTQWEKSEYQDLSKEDLPGTSIKESTEDAFQRVLEQILLKKPSATSLDD